VWGVQLSALTPEQPINCSWHSTTLNLLPYTSTTAPCVPCRSDAAQWPGGGVSSYLARLQQEVLPWVAQQYGASLRPQDLALAGSSFGGVAALAAGMSSHQEGGCAFGALLVESPSMWIGDEAFLRVGGGGGGEGGLLGRGSCKQYTHTASPVTVQTHILVAAANTTCLGAVGMMLCVSPAGYLLVHLLALSIWCV